MNLGSGPATSAPGWVHVDRDAHHGSMVGDPLTGLQWPDGTFDLIVANHVLQMVAWPDLVPWLAETRRVLAEGGVLRLLVPDLLGAVGAWRRHDASWFPISDDHERSIDGKLCMYVTQAGATRSVFTAEWLTELCERAGYTGSKRVAPGQTVSTDPRACDLDTRDAESVVVEAWR